MNIKQFIGILMGLVLTLNITAQSNPLGLKVGSKLTYSVNQDRRDFDMVVVVKAIDDKGITLSWQNPNLKTKGNITLTSLALASAKRLFMNFTNGVTTKKDNLATFFLPTTSFKELKTSGKTDIFLEQNKQTTAFKLYMTRNYDVKINGNIQQFQALLGLNQDNADHPKVIMPLDYETFPILLGMDWDYRIALKAVDNP